MIHVVPLLNGKAVATRVTKARDMLRMDRERLASLSPRHHSTRLASVRIGATELWRIDAMDPDDWTGLLWVVEIDIEEGEVRNLDDVTLHNSARDRAALLEFLAWREAVPDCWHMQDQFARLAMSPALIGAVHRGEYETMTVRFNHARWAFTLGWPGVLAAVAGPDDRLSGWPIDWWLLSGPASKPFAVLAWNGRRVVDEDGDDINPDFADPVGGYTMGLATRVALRDACLGQPHLQERCGAAFAAEGAGFLEDWFAISPAPCGPGPIGRPLPPVRRIGASRAG